MSGLAASVADYLFLVVVYSTIAVLVVEVLLRIWGLERPETRVRFRFLALLLPPVCALVFNLLYPERRAADFRDSVALADSRRWLEPDLGSLQLWQVVLPLLALIAFPFILQMAAPLLRRQVSPREVLLDPGEEEQVRLKAAVKEASPQEGLRPQVLVSGDPEPMAYLGGVRRPRLVLSLSLLQLLDEEELQGVLGHELAHLGRRDNWLGWGLLGLCLLMLYNPAALFTAQRLMQDNEKACDDAAARRTGRPLALASGLLKTFPHSAPAGKGLATWVGSLEYHARKVFLEQRVRRLLQPDPDPGASYEAVRLALLGAGLTGLLFFVV